ncbi:MAG: hypothetical protein WCA08_08840 [Desulfoferrobacter sp.]
MQFHNKVYAILVCNFLSPIPCILAYLPFALNKTCLKVAKEWGWQYVFPSSGTSVDPRSREKRRHYIEETILQKTDRLRYHDGKPKFMEANTLI